MRQVNKHASRDNGPDAVSAGTPLYKRRAFLRSLSAVLAAVGLKDFAARAGDTRSDLGRFPFWNPKLPLSERVADLIGRLTLQEKISLMYFFQAAIPRLGIKRYNLGNEALHGAVRPGRFTVFPEAIGLAATWNPAVIERMTTAISDEARAKYNRTGGVWNKPSGRYGNHGQLMSGLLVFWSPVVNLARNPRWGRNQETYGEDPWLTSRLGAAFTRGMQGRDPKYLKTVSTPKHFAGYSWETGRMGENVVAPESYFFDYEFAGFKACITEAKAASIMAAYDAINGVPCSCNRWLLTDVLRTMWGFEGFVVSDCGAVSHICGQQHYVKTPEEAAAAAVNAGLDMEGGWWARYPNLFNDYLAKAVALGLCSESTVDQALSRVLSVEFRLGMFDPPDQVPFSKIPASVIGCAKHVALARQLACESMVLLKNSPTTDGKILLPLAAKAVKSIVVCGPNAAVAVFGDYSGTPIPPAVTPLDGITAALPHAKVTHLAWPKRPAKAPLKVPSISTGQQTQIKQADVVVAVLGLNTHYEIEGMDRPNIYLPPDQEQYIKDVVALNKNVVVVLQSGSAVAINWINDNVPAILQSWYPGEQGGNAIADVLFGRYNPGGRLPLTFYASEADVPALQDCDIAKGQTYMYIKKPPLYPFGYGLSYTTFSYSSLKLSARHVSPTGILRASFTLSNTGKRKGDEVVQVYVTAPPGKQPRPIRQLKAFKRLTLRPGESREVGLDLRIADWGFWDSKLQDYRVDEGAFVLAIGSSSAEAKLTARVTVRA